MQHPAPRFPGFSLGNVPAGEVTGLAPRGDAGDLALAVTEAGLFSRTRWPGLGEEAAAAMVVFDAGDFVLGFPPVARRFSSSFG